MTIVVEVADYGGLEPELVEAFDNVRHGFRSVIIIDGNANQLRAGCGKGGNLRDTARDISGIGIGHGLHNDRCVGADAYVADGGDDSFSAMNLGHTVLLT
jgi:hypothetical protein